MFSEAFSCDLIKYHVCEGTSRLYILIMLIVLCLYMCVWFVHDLLCSLCIFCDESVVRFIFDRKTVFCLIWHRIVHYDDKVMGRLEWKL